MVRRAAALQYMQKALQPPQGASRSPAPASPGSAGPSGYTVADGGVEIALKDFSRIALSVGRCSSTHGGAAKTADDRSTRSVARRCSYGSSAGGAHSTSCNCSLARSFTAG